MNGTGTYKFGATAKEKPIYLQIFVNAEMSKDELTWIYNKAREYHIIELTDEEIEKRVCDYMNADEKCPFEFKCREFKEAFECAMEICIAQSDIYKDGRFTVQISEDSIQIANSWLDEKRDFVRKINDLECALLEKENTIRDLEAQVSSLTDILAENENAIHDLKEQVKQAEREEQKQKPFGVNSNRYDLDGFDPLTFADPYYDKIDGIDKYREIELCSELMTEMILADATYEEIGKVVKYSMIVLDTVKLKLNWIIAKRVFEIDQLCEKYGVSKESDIEWVIFINDQFFDFAESLEAARQKVIEKRGYLGGRLLIKPNRDKDGKYILLKREKVKLI